MKFLKVEVTRTSSTDLYVEVPDDYEPTRIMRHDVQHRLGEIAEETTDVLDWDDYGWEETIEVQGVSVVTEDEARKFNVGKLVSALAAERPDAREGLD